MNDAAYLSYLEVCPSQEQMGSVYESSGKLRGF